MTALSERAKKLYLEGRNCTEAILHALQQTTMHDVPNQVLYAAIGFRAGFGGSGCACGAISGATMAIGVCYGGSKASDKSKIINDLTKLIYDKFIEKYSVPCCDALTANYNFDSPERKAFCSNIVEYVAEELDKILPNS